MFYVSFSVVECQIIEEFPHGKAESKSHLYKSNLSVDCDHGYHLKYVKSDGFQGVESLDDFLLSLIKYNQTFTCSKNAEWTDEAGNIVTNATFKNICQRK